MKKVNYLNNRDILKEIHKSKMSFTDLKNEDYYMYDIIVQAKYNDDNTGEHPFLVTDPVNTILTISKPEKEDTYISMIDQAKLNRCKRLNYDKIAAYIKENPEGARKDVTQMVPEDINEEDLVYRVMTFEHIPFEPGRKKNPKTVEDLHPRLNFLPFKHYVIINNELVEVCRSHSVNGEYSLTCGNITDKLANMYIRLVDRFARPANYRSYTYLDEMKGEALLQLSHMGLRFNEYKSDNPFSYYTSSVYHSFVRILNSEKKQQGIRDSLLEKQGAAPSLSRQMAHEEAIRQLRESSNGP